MFKCKSCGRKSVNTPKQCPVCGEKRPAITLSPRQVFKDVSPDAELYLYILVGVLVLALLAVIGLVVYALL